MVFEVPIRIMKYTDKITTTFICGICGLDIGEETGPHREEKKHYEFIGRQFVKRTYTINKPN